MIMQSIPLSLNDIIIRNNLAIFVGAGLSFNFVNTQGTQLKGWNNLVREILTFLSSEGFNVNNLMDSLDLKEPISILTEIEKIKDVPIDKIRKFVANYYSLSHSNYYELHHNLSKLANIIVTTNYDNAFELTIKDIKTIVAGKNTNLFLLENTKEKILFKLHGCINDDKTMVIFESDYNQLYNIKLIKNTGHDKYEKVLLCLQKLILNKSVLFIGCGMGDFQINNIFKGVKSILKDSNQNHYIISNEKLSKELDDFLTLIPISDFSEIPEIIQYLLNMKKSNDIDVQEEKEVQYIHNLFLEAIEQDINRNFNKAIQLYKKIISLNPKFDLAYINMGIIYYQLAYEKEDTSLRIKQLNKAIAFFKKAISISPENDLPYSNIGAILLDLGDFFNKKRYYVECVEISEKALSFNEKNYMAICNIGSAYKGVAMLDKNSSVLKKSIKYYQKAIRLYPYTDEAFFLMGTALSELAEFYNDEKLYIKSLSFYKQAVSFNQNCDKIFFNWGNAIYKLAELKKDKELFLDCFEKYNRAIRINPNNYQAYNNWGLSLHSLSIIENNIDLLLESIDKYKQALNINPNYETAIKNLNSLLSKLSHK